MKCIVSSIVSVAITLVVASHAQAALVGSYSVGNGSNASHLQFDFTNSNSYLYEVRYDGAMFGDDLFAIVAAAQPSFFSFVVTTYSFGDALTGVTIGNDTDAGFGTPPDYLDYWHYWTRDNSESAWTESWVGFTERAVSNGSSDGWVFNSAGAPSVVPAPTVAALFLLTPLARRRRRR